MDIKVAIMQPTYLPWAGYFALMSRVNHFVFLDDVQFAKRSWQQRNQIKTTNGVQLLTVPVLSSGRERQNLNKVLIDSHSNYSIQHIKTIKQNYSKSKYFKSYFPDIENILLKNKSGLLIDLNIELINYFRHVLGITNNTLFSSNLKSEGAKSSYLLEICKELGCTHYLSPPGSSEYLDFAIDEFISSSIRVSYFEYAHPQYQQHYPPFIPYMSSLDIIFNEGPKSMDVILSGELKKIS